MDYSFASANWARALGEHIYMKHATMNSHLWGRPHAELEGVPGVRAGVAEGRCTLEGKMIHPEDLQGWS